MQITTRSTDISIAGSPLRIYVSAPDAAGKYPGILMYSDIFQLTGPMIRACHRLAGYGFVVAAPEIYHRLESPGTVIPFDDDGRTRGLSNATRTPDAIRLAGALRNTDARPAANNAIASAPTIQFMAQFPPR